MAALDALLADTQAAFDDVAATYHRDNEDNPILSAMRMRTVRTIEALLPPGAHLLDLGCGPGTDAAVLARRGYQVTAIDASPRMIDEAARRAGACGGAITVRRLAIQDVAALSPQRFDAAYSDFGPLNCVPDLAAVARDLAARLRPGGVLIASVIGRVCPWELAIFIARGDLRRARVRFARAAAAVPLNGHTVWTRYYSPREFEHCFRAAGFERLSLRALGLFVPPPYAHRFAERHPSLVRWLQAAEDRTGGWPGLRNWGDHFLIALKVR